MPYKNKLESEKSYHNTTAYAKKTVMLTGRPNRDEITKLDIETIQRCNAKFIYIEQYIAMF